MHNSLNTFDKIVKSGASTIQLGENNNRVYLMKLAIQDHPGMAERLVAMAHEHNLSKVFAKSPEWARQEFLQQGYIQEGHIPCFYNGSEAVYFMSRFLKVERSILSGEDDRLINHHIAIAKSKATNVFNGNIPENVMIRKLDGRDTRELTMLYKRVFGRYPFPIFEEEYIATTMAEHIRYFGAFIEGKLIAASSSEMDMEGCNAEMTDFAVIENYRGMNLSLFLLREMEKEMITQGIRTAFTIARSFSAGMNVAFARSGYHFGGTLINNTNIVSKIESMNVWYKGL